MALDLTIARPRSEMNVTPFIDVLLVLIVIFMMSVQMLTSIQMQLALETQTGSFAADQPIVLELPDSGGILVNQRSIAPADLPGFLTNIYFGRQESVLFVKSGPSRSWRETVEMVDVATGAGVRTVALAP